YEVGVERWGSLMGLGKPWRSLARQARLRRRRTMACAVSLAAFLLTTLVAVTPSASEAATTVTVSGFVFRDLDNDGVRDPGEPGVPGVRVHRTTGNGTPSTVTAADGSYVLSGLTPRSSGYLAVMTGWFRSQCTTLNCASGPGPDNDYTTRNAFVQYPLS